MKCDHDFQVTYTPPDCGRKWYQCTKCAVFAYRRSRKMTPYKCTTNGCSKPAVTRDPGRGPRACILWKCAEHGGKHEGA